MIRVAVASLWAASFMSLARDNRFQRPVKRNARHRESRKRRRRQPVARLFITMDSLEPCQDNQCARRDRIADHRALQPCDDSSGELANENCADFRRAERNLHRALRSGERDVRSRCLFHHKRESQHDVNRCRTRCSVHSKNYCF